jgi:hypothetical protein
MEIQSSMFPEFLGTASKATIKTSDTVVILAIADLGSATGAANTQPNHQGCPWEVHRSTVVLLAMNSSAINCHSPGKIAVTENPVCASD